MSQNSLPPPLEDSRTKEPALELWYGHHQVFGSPGNPQRWINLLGRVSEPLSLASLHSLLNGGASRPISIGPNRRRLVGPGDFNIDIDRAELVAGTNTATICATNKWGEETVADVTIESTKGATWPLPWVSDWDAVSSIQQVPRWWTAGGVSRAAVFGQWKWATIG